MFGIFSVACFFKSSQYFRSIVLLYWSYARRHWPAFQQHIQASLKFRCDYSYWCPFKIENYVRKTFERGADDVQSQQYWALKTKPIFAPCETISQITLLSIFSFWPPTTSLCLRPLIGALLFLFAADEVLISLKTFLCLHFMWSHVAV